MCQQGLVLRTATTGPRTLVTGGCLLLVFAPDGATGNDDDDEGLALLLIGNT